MREKFELSCKVVGLIFFCWGILTFFGAIVFFILKPDYVQMLTESTRDAYIQSQI